MKNHIKIVLGSAQNLLKLQKKCFDNKHLSNLERKRGLGVRSCVYSLAV